MLGLGEDEINVIEAMRDLRDRDVSVLTLGQYLSPTRGHLPVSRYITPEEFNRYREIGYNMGFMLIHSGPLVRSSYHAAEVTDKMHQLIPGPDCFNR
jgi:lipoic acid synthetase